MPSDTKARKTKETDNPKINPPKINSLKIDPASVDNQIKDPEEWVSGHEPMTGAQASYLKTLSEQAHDPDAYDPKLDKAEASKRIDQLRQDRKG